MIIGSNRASNDHKVESIRNSEGQWINTSYFREEAIHYTKNGYYCPDPVGSPAWLAYWTEQLDRCINGYTVGGASITGHHYAYLNFCPILKMDMGVDSGRVSGNKVVGFPDFWDGDYNYFWTKEIARNGMSYHEYKALKLLVNIDEEDLIGGFHMIVGKSRRKGYSYKNAAICANTYNTVRRSTTIIGAFDKKFLYPEGTMAMASKYLDFFNASTGWGKAREFVDKQDHKRASFEMRENGLKSEAGYLSQIIALSFGDNPDAARGKDAKEVLFEEAGAFPNLEESYKATKPGLTAGKFITGQMTVFGTGGDMAKGTVAFAKMYYNPKEFGALAFTNIWDKNAEATKCGFFHPVTWNMEGHYDKQGNSDIEGATEFEDSVRDDLRKNSTSSLSIQSRVQEYPYSPEEAFLTVSTNDFPVIELRNRLAKVRRENLHLKLGQPVKLYRNEKGKVKAEPILDGSADPIWDYRPKNKDLTGCPVIFIHPSPNPIKGVYKIGFDPYRQVLGTSAASIIVYKAFEQGDYTRDQIVAMYVGRPYSPDHVNHIAELFAELYNAEIMYENEVREVQVYFERKKKLHLLALQPDRAIGQAVKNSKVRRVWGCHMNEQLKDSGEKYIKEWLLRERDVDEDGNILTTIDFINDPGLLEELIEYNRKGNFDRVMSLMQIMFALKEDEEGKVYENKENNNAKDLLHIMETQFKKSTNFAKNIS